MTRFVSTAAIAAAIGMAAFLQGCSSQSNSMAMADDKPQVVKDNMAKMAAGGVEQCFGVSAAGKNDCASGAHACAGMSTMARDPASFVLVPSGACAKIDGSTMAAM